MRVNSHCKVHRGASGKELYFQAYQLILWKQCHALITIMGFPDELEHVVKNLWALRLQLLKGHVEATPDEVNLFSSQPQTGKNESKVDKTTHKRTLRLDKVMPSLVDSLGICYMGMMLLRLPVGIGELHRWAMQGDIPFIRAIRVLPEIIKTKLPAEYFNALETTSALELDQLRGAVNDLVRFYSHHFGVILPPLNAPLLLFKYVRSLALPINVFRVVRSLAALLSIDFSFPGPGKQQRASTPPEVCLLCLLIVSVKLHHPFDNLPRSAASVDDPAIMKINWSKWIDAQKDHESRIRAGSYLARGSELQTKEEDVMKMSGEQMDDYLNWYERTWIDEERAQTKHRPLNEDFRKWFPIASGGYNVPSLTKPGYAEQVSRESQSAEQFSVDVISTLQMRDVTTESKVEGSGGNVMAIGSRYKRYRTREDLTAHALKFHEVAADAMGMNLATLLRAVFQIEERLLMWKRLNTKDKKKGGRKGKGKDMDEESHLAVSDIDLDEMDDLD